MRKSSAFMMAIMLFAFGAIFAAGGATLKPLAHDAEVSKELTKMLSYRRDIAEGTRVMAFRRIGGEGRLASEGRGVILQLTPSAGICRRRGGLRLLALRVAQEAVGRYPGAGLEWVEVQFEWEGAEKGLQTLFETPGGRIQSEPKPAMPQKFTPPGHEVPPSTGAGTGERRGGS